MSVYRKNATKAAVNNICQEYVTPTNVLMLLSTAQICHRAYTAGTRKKTKLAVNLFRAREQNVQATNVVRYLTKALPLNVIQAVATGIALKSWRRSVV